MAWRRTNNGNFSPKQHERMIAMHEAGVSTPDIAKEAGCSPVSVRRILNLAKSGEDAISTNQPAENVLKEENSYLRWVVSGTINHVKGSTYIDKLVSDLGDGKFNP
jgi:hypothetical protein